ncbi:MAG TPA: universal stress protein [Steroidobacter sp.]|uniref:universal stress protein n=1 Tax=Steroidobacter sp. TaxID=1978227 RepID=UPI002EDB414F
MISKILAPVDGSSTSMRGLAEAVSLVKQVNGTLRILHSVDELLMGDVPLGTDYYNRWVESVRVRGQQILREAQAFCRERHVDAEAILAETVGKRAADIIIDQAKQWPADLIVMGTHGRRGINRLLMGSDAELVLRSSPVPVMLVREHTESTWVPGVSTA